MQFHFCTPLNQVATTIEQAAPEEEQLTKAFAQSAYPLLLKEAGPFIEMTETLAQQLNTDFRLKPALLPSIASLFASAIIHSPHTVIKFLTVEVYSRHASLDIHCESSSLASTLPQDRSSYYPDIFCGTSIDADGKGLKRKLIVSSTTMNVLSTCSTTTNMMPEISIGPNTVCEVDSQHTRIYFQASAIDKFQCAFESGSTSEGRGININSLRQLVSGHDAPSTYKPLRATFSPFDDIQHMPATIFTNCDLPSHAGYGSNATSAPKLASELLQLFARAAVTNSPSVDKQQFMELRHKFDSVTNKDAKQWTALNIIMKAANNELDSTGRIDVYTFAADHGLHGIVDVAGSVLSDANAKVQQNIKARLSYLYGAK